MDVMTYLIQPAAALCCAAVLYIFLYRGKQSLKASGHYTQPDWNFYLKKWWAAFHVRQLKRQRDRSRLSRHDVEKPQMLLREESSDSQLIYGADQHGNSLLAKVTRRRHRIAELWIVLRTNQGKVYQLPNHPDTVISNNNSRGWSAGGLQFTILEPFTRARITFNGLLREGIRNEWNSENEDSIKHVRFNFIWTACSDPMHWPHDWSPSLMADALAREPWRDGNWIHMVSKFESGGYDQYGVFNGVINIGNGDEQVMSLPGIRQRRWGPHKAAHLHRTASFIGVCSDGAVFLIGANSSREGLTHSMYGNIRAASGKVYPVSNCDLRLANIVETSAHIPKTFTIRFSAGGRSYTAILQMIPQNYVHLLGGRPWDWEAKVIPYECSLNGSQGVGVTQFWYPYRGQCPIEPIPRVRHLVHTDDKPQPDEYVVSLTQRVAQSPAVVGGKGASLALLISVINKTYEVPPGVCLTVSALNLQLETEAIKCAVEEVNNISRRKKDGSLEDACLRAVEVIQQTPVNAEVAQAIQTSLKTLRQANGDDGSMKFAVRSSGVGEDSEELSAAGQNETVLGCLTDEDVLKGVQKCWASLYAYQSVYYRRHYGQPVNCGMGVVIQVMVPAEAAGVMFTRHPTSGDPSSIYITANYGLGETVVSAKVEPDTVIINREWTGNLSHGSSELGRKCHFVKLAAGGGTVEQELSENESKQLCISEADALRLAELGVKLEAMYGAPTDVEWAIFKDKIYLLQARPITSLTQFTDFELTHEMDTACMSAEDVTTFANTGEVLPGATSILSLSTLVKELAGATKAVAGEKPSQFFTDSLAITHNHVGMNYINMFMKAAEPEQTKASKMQDIAVCGHVVNTPEMRRTGIHRFGTKKLATQLKEMHLLVKSIWKAKSIARDAQEFSNQFNINVSKYATPKELHNRITESLVHISYISASHSSTSTASFGCQVIAMMIIAQEDSDLTLDHYNDIGLLLSSCVDVVSAEVPLALKDITNTILMADKEKEFCKQAIKDVPEWLRKSCPAASTLFHDFVRKYGHRGIKEFDLVTETWGIDSDQLIATLQSSLATLDISAPPSGFLAPLTVNDIVSRLKSPKNNTTRFILKKLIPLFRNAVTCRESTKEALIKVIHEFRLAYRYLGNMLVAEGQLPEMELIFFMSNNEIKRLINTGDANIISKAWRRKRLHSQWEELEFSEMNIGVPIPLKIEINDVYIYNVAAHGTPVCSGDVVGRACVINNFSEVSDIRRGDILITRSTDIGWSPYFPMLGGVVTELGGLISHGAVVARECGLPCIVGVQSATAIFNTGDTVKLSGSAGTISRIEEPSIEN